MRTSIIYQSIYPYIQFVRARVLTQVGEVVSAVLLAARTGFFPYLRSCNRMRSHVVTKKTWTFDFEYSSWIDKLEGWISKRRVSLVQSSPPRGRTVRGHRSVGCVFWGLILSSVVHRSTRFKISISCPPPSWKYSLFFFFFSLTVLDPNTNIFDIFLGLFE